MGGKEVSCPRGEIQLYGPSIMKEYCKNEKATAETFTEDGWLRTGDLGRINPNKTISIVGRIKDNFKLGNGEYIAVETVEGVYGRATSVQQLWVSACLADRNWLVAVVCPDYKWAVQVLQDAGKWPADQTVDDSPGFFSRFHKAASEHRAFLTEKVKANLKQVEVSSLRYTEKIKAIILETELTPLVGNELGNGFTIDNGCATVTMKLRRTNLEERYGDQLKQLYTQPSTPTK